MKCITMEEIKGRKKNRMFASFRNEKEQNDRLNELIERIPKKYTFDLCVFIGQLESTFIDGFSDDNKEVADGQSD